MTDLLQVSNEPAWVVHEEGYDPLRERGVESRLTISNGFVGVRGVPAIHGEKMYVSWPRTYVAGLFDTPAKFPRILSLVSAPDWVGVNILINGAPLLQRPDDLDLLRRTLDMRRGALFTKWRPRLTGGPILLVRSVRLVSLADRQNGLELIEIEFADEADITLEAGGTAADPALEPLKVTRDVGAWHIGETGQGLAMATAAALRIDGHDQAPVTLDGLTWLWRWKSAPGQVARFSRLVSFVRCDDLNIDPAPVALEELEKVRGQGNRGVIKRHEDAWDARWHCSDIEVVGDAAAQHALRFAAFHMISAGNPEDERISIGARALTGEDYHGHVFWDTEIYLLPFYTMTWPQAARALLMYRYHGLAGARTKASQKGWQGAFYAWESARTGDETTPEVVISADGTAVKVVSGQEEEHISADVAYAVWHYWQATGDDGFLQEAGAEILFETARFWASRAEPEADGNSHIRGVEGPDEYHEHIDDSAFTNVMARWNIRRAVEVAALLRERWPTRWDDIAGRIRLTVQELEGWTTVADTLATGLDRKTGLYEQFAGFFKLDPIDLTQYAGRTTAMDVVLGRDRTQRSQVIKQADVVALIALLPEEFDDKSRLANFRYYEPRCDHGSSLSRAMHAQVAARLGDTDLAMRYFREAASIDLADTAWRSAGGVHIATLGGLWQAAVFGFAGLSIAGNAVAFDPHLPPDWDSLGFRFQWRQRSLKVKIEHAGLRFNATLEDGEPMTVLFAGKEHGLAQETPLNIEAPFPDDADANQGKMRGAA